MTELKKVLTFKNLVTISAGFAVASSGYVTCIAVAMNVAGDSAWIAILVGGILTLLATTCFSELNEMYPSAAGIKLWLDHAFSGKLALTIILVYTLSTLSSVGIETYVLSHVFYRIIPSISPYTWIVLFLIFVALINIRGIKIAGTTQLILTSLMFLTMWGISFIGLTKEGPPLESVFNPGGAANLFIAIATSIFLFFSFEWVTTMAEEVIDNRQISRAMTTAVLILMISYSLITMTMTRWIDMETLVNSPIPHLLIAEKLGGEKALYILIFMSVLASITSFNAGVSTTSRMVYALSRERSLPKFLSKIHLTYATPWIAILTLWIYAMIVSSLTFLTGRFLTLILLAAAAECIIYSVVAISVIQLRKREPDVKRGYVVRGGYVIPVIVAVVFGFLTFTVFLESSFVAIVLLGVLIVSAFYSYKIVPKMKERYLLEKKKRRRPKSADLRKNNRNL